MEDFPKNLRAWRESRNMSQKRLAEAAGLSLATVYQAELGKVKPQKKTLEKLLNYIRSCRSEDSAFEVSTLAKPEAPKEAVDELAIPAEPAIPTEPEVCSSSTTVVTKEPRKSSKTEFAGAIKLTNLDLELINRALNLSMKEKLALIEKLID